MTWLYDLQTLASRFGWGVASDVAAMNIVQLWTLFTCLKSILERG